MIKTNPNQNLTSFVEKLKQLAQKNKSTFTYKLKFDILKSKEYYYDTHQIGLLGYPKSPLNLMIFQLLGKIDIHFIDLIDDLDIVRYEILPKNGTWQVPEYYIFYRDALVATSIYGEGAPYFTCETLEIFKKYHENLRIDNLEARIKQIERKQRQQNNVLVPSYFPEMFQQKQQQPFVDYSLIPNKSTKSKKLSLKDDAFRKAKQLQQALTKY